MTTVLTALLLVGALAALVLIARRPEWGAPFFAFVLFIRLSDALRGEFGTPSVFQFLAPGLLVILVGRWMLMGDRAGRGWKPAAWLLTAYGAVCLLSLLYAQDTERTRLELMKQLDGILIVLVMSTYIRESRDVRRVVWSLLLAGLFLSTLTVWQQISGNFESSFAGFSRVEIRNIHGNFAGGRAEGPVAANYYAILLVLLVPMAIDRMIHERPVRLRLLAGLTLLLVLASIVFTYSRGALVALAVVGLLLIIWLNLRRVLIVGGALLLISPFVLPAAYIERASTFTEIVGLLRGEMPRDSAIVGRLSEVTSALMMFRDAPVVGVGYGNFELQYPKYSRELALDGRNTDRAAHSLYLEIAAETGVIGLLAFGSLMGYSVLGVWRARRQAEEDDRVDLSRALSGFGIGFIGYLTGSLFLHLSYPRYFWLLIGIGLGFYALAPRTAPAQTSQRQEPAGREVLV